MRLFEEYFLRHQITDVKIAHHCESERLILKSISNENKYKWIVLAIDWVNHNQHPGHYEIDISTPVHNYNNFSMIAFSQIAGFHKKWSEYEDFFFKDKEFHSLIKNYKVVKNSEDAFFISWEMFVFSHDVFFARQPAVIKSNLFNSLDEDNSLEMRKSFIQKNLDFIEVQFPLIFKNWKKFLSNANRQPDWLVKLIPQIQEI